MRRRYIQYDTRAGFNIRKGDRSREHGMSSSPRQRERKWGWRGGGDKISNPLLTP